MARFCGNCGTEVDDAAVFCPTCGQPVDEAAASEIPEAPAWPDAAPADTAAGDDPDAAPTATPRQAEEQEEAAPAAERWGEYGRRDLGAAPPAEAADVPTRVEQRPPQAADAGEPRPGHAAAPTPGRDAPDERSTPAERPGLPQVDLPFTMPVTLSGWLIGGGMLLAAIGVVIILLGNGLNAIDLLLLVALVAVAATVFLSTSLPAIPNLRLISLVVALITFGVALDRVGFGGGGAGELLLFMGAAAAAIGAVILELGQDQPLGRPQR